MKTKEEKKTALETANEYAGPCTCHEIYTSRGKRPDPACFRCMYAKDIADLLESYARPTIEGKEEGKGEYQLCPKCLGTGYAPNYSHQIPMDIDTCDVCSGVKVIARPPLSQPSGTGKEEVSLLRELTMRANLAFPENEQDLKWFDEGTDCKKEGGRDFSIRLFEALSLGTDITKEEFENMKKDYDKNMEQHNKQKSFRYPFGK